jgi:hypothetical protein
MSSRAKKFLLLAVAAALLTVNGFLLPVLNRERAAIGITRLEPLENAPPMLALTTQVLGGFRGLIANALWLRTTQLQDEGKYFEMVQLADWITKLEPHIITVWQVQSWNMAFNISVKFPDYSDRWRWVQRGIELLRDEALRYNPDAPLLFADLEWLFRFKMGQNLDDAHFYYKLAWAMEMMNVFGGERPDFDKLIHPQTSDENERALLLRQKYKMDAEWMRTLNARYGPLDWRLPEAHALYWSSIGMMRSKKDDDVRRLRQGIYQSMQLSFQRGTLVLSSNAPPRLFPNLEIAPKVNAAFEAELANAPDTQTNSIGKAHRNFLRDAVYQFFIVERTAEAQQWLNYLRQRFPETVPPDTTLAEFAFERATDTTQEQSYPRTVGLIRAFVVQSYRAAIRDNPDEFNAYMLKAAQLWNAYTQRTKSSKQRLELPSLNEFKTVVRDQMLSPESNLQPEERLRLRAFFQMPLQTPAPAPNPAK